eukprot:1177602-Prorocentrum_minimum.AAC.3
MRQRRCASCSQLHDARGNLPRPPTQSGEGRGHQRALVKPPCGATMTAMQPIRTRSACCAFGGVIRGC